MWIALNTKARQKRIINAGRKSYGNQILSAVFAKKLYSIEAEMHYIFLRLF